MTQEIRIGCAGWEITREHAARFAAGESHLERYATRFTATEINSSFYKPHRPSTYESWGSTVPDNFRFAVKAPKQLTHVSRLADLSSLNYFLDDLSPLGDRLGPILLQLPPGLAFDAERIASFLLALRFRYKGNVVCEPRHSTWFSGEADKLLAEHQVARVAADPVTIPEAGLPGGWNGLVYVRLHGTPRLYYSRYNDEYLDKLAPKLTDWAQSAPVWCIFDNTAEGAATVNALGVMERLGLAKTE